MDYSSLPSPASAVGPGEGQVCDRCRVKKVKCDGKFPACTNCVSSKSPCVVSTKLRRKTKIRGFRHDVQTERVRILQAKNDALKSQLEAEKKHNESLRAQERLLSPSASQPIRTAAPRHHHQGQTDPEMATAGSQTSEHGRSALLIKHMGRLVLDGEGTERFCGSTTGVHFVLSVEQALKKRTIIRDRLPEDCYRLQFLHPAPQPSLHLVSESWPAQSALGMMVRQTLNQPLGVYTRQIIMFGERWTGICPVVAESDLLRDVSDALKHMSDLSRPLSLSDLATSLKLATILLINSSSSPQDIPQQKKKECRELTVALLPIAESVGTLNAVQGIALFSLYLLLCGHLLSMPRLNGVMVQIAQALGLHRHSRRFKFSQGQVEMRKRLWWWIYGFDKIVSIAHGTPQLIQEDDVDVEYPLDCEMDQVEASQLNLPLPGESTAVSDFIAFAHLSRILAGILQQLYTTTDRRHGEKKITKLRGELQAWSQHFRTKLADPVALPSGSIEDADFPRLWLSALLAKAEILIHRPGLTFDENSPEFRDCLDHCSGSSAVLIQLLCSHCGRECLAWMMPLGPATLFQSGLMHLYYQLHSGDAGEEWGRVPTDSSVELIAMASELLQNYPTLSITPGIESCERSRSFGDALKTSGLLLASLAGLITGSEAQAASQSTLDVSMPTPMDGTGSLDGVRNSARDEEWVASILTTPGSLGDINQHDYLDWVLDSPFSSLPT